MDEDLRALVRQRAESRGEYCGLHQDYAPFATFHVEHVIPRMHGGGDVPSNLALACDRCNLHKGPNLAGIDPGSGEMAPLYNPRTQTWHEHFRFEVATPLGTRITC